MNNAANSPMNSTMNSEQLQELRNNLAAAEADLTRIQNTQRDWESIKIAKDSVAEHKQEQSDATALEAECRQALSSLLESATSAWRDRVNRYMPRPKGRESEWIYGFRVSKAALVRGLVQPNGQLYVALSKVQEGVVLVAEAMAMSETDKDMRIITPTDESWQADIKADIMRAWRSYSGRVLFCTPELPKGRLPAGWEHIDMDAVVTGWKRDAGVVDDVGSGDVKDANVEAADDVDSDDVDTVA